LTPAGPDISAYRGYIEAALEFAGHSHTFDDVAALVASGDAQFWPGAHSAVVTQIVSYPQYRALSIWLAGGELPEIELMAPTILEFGRRNGCKVASFVGRRGWERTFLARTGWQPRLVVFEKPLDE
jgi:hypothetical protein